MQFPSSIIELKKSAPGACEDVSAVVEAADHADLVRMVARLEPIIFVKG